MRGEEGADLSGPWTRARRWLRRRLKGVPQVDTEIPGQAPIRLVAFYDDFLGYYPQCEMRTKAWLVDNMKPDWTVLDCGANIGYFSLLFARLAPRGRVFAFEPTRTYAMLLENLRYHGADNVTPLRLAVGRQSGRHPAAVARIWGRKLESGELDFITVDDFVERERLERVDLIKVDVDSYDLEALLGAEQTLARFNPFLLIELTDIALMLRGTSTNAALAWLARRGYDSAVVIEDCNYLLKRGWQAKAEIEGRAPLTLHLP